MFVGTLTARLRIREARSLKDKRQVVRSILDRLRANCNVSAAEVGELENHQLVELGIAMVGAESHPVRVALEQIAENLRRHPIAEYIDSELDVDGRGDL